MRAVPLSILNNKNDRVLSSYNNDNDSYNVIIISSICVISLVLFLAFCILLIYRFVGLWVCVFICWSVFLFVFLFVCLFVCLFIRVFLVGFLCSCLLLNLRMLNYRISTFSHKSTLQSTSLPLQEADVAI